MARFKLIERYDGSREFYRPRAPTRSRPGTLLQGRLTSSQRSTLKRLDRQMDALLATR